MDESKGYSSDRNILCLFDVDGTLTPPREVSYHKIHFIVWLCLRNVGIISRNLQMHCPLWFNSFLVASSAFCRAAFILIAYTCCHVSSGCKLCNALVM